jgi:hypothetical protein
VDAEANKFDSHLKQWLIRIGLYLSLSL